jgi:hypothetical protein
LLLATALVACAELDDDALTDDASLHDDAGLRLPDRVAFRLGDRAWEATAPIYEITAYDHLPEFDGRRAAVTRPGGGAGEPAGLSYGADAEGRRLLHLRLGDDRLTFALEAAGPSFRLTPLAPLAGPPRRFDPIGFPDVAPIFFANAAAPLAGVRHFASGAAADGQVSELWLHDEVAATSTYGADGYLVARGDFLCEVTLGDRAFAPPSCRFERTSTATGAGDTRLVLADGSAVLWSGRYELRSRRTTRGERTVREDGQDACIPTVRFDEEIALGEAVLRRSRTYDAIVEGDARTKAGPCPR